MMMFSNILKEIFLIFYIKTTLGFSYRNIDNNLNSHKNCNVLLSNGIHNICSNNNNHHEDSNERIQNFNIFTKNSQQSKNRILHLNFYKKSSPNLGFFTLHKRFLFFVLSHKTTKIETSLPFFVVPFFVFFCFHFEKLLFLPYFLLLSLLPHSFAFPPRASPSCFDFCFFLFSLYFFFIFKALRF